MAEPRRRVLVWAVGTAVGEAVAREAAANGAEVVTVGRDPDGADGPAGAAGSPGALGLPLLRDSTADPGLVERWVAEHWGGLDALIDCSAAMELWPEADDSAEAASAVIATNVMEPWVHTESMRPFLRHGHAPGVVLLGSVDGAQGNPHVPAYSAGKAAVASVARTLAARLGGDGIRVNCVAAAGVVPTDQAAGPPRRTTGDADLARRLTPMGRFPTALEIARVALFLASELASGVSGAVVPVDGGRSAVTPGTWSGPA